MNNRMMICFLFLLLGAFFAVSCDNASDDNDDDNDNIDNDDNNDSGTDDDTFDYPPVCTEPYVEYPAWFEPINLYEKAGEFDELYGYTFVTGKVTLAADIIILSTVDWLLEIEWQTERPHPFTDKMEVLIFAGYQFEDDICGSEPLLWVLDATGGLLLYHDPFVPSYPEPFDNLTRSFTFTRECDYQTGQPPLYDNDLEWFSVFDMSLVGEVGGVAFSVSPGSKPALSDDGSFDVYLPYSYAGKNDYDDEGADISGQVERALLEIVRRPAD